MSETAGERRLWALIEERALPGADRRAIDERIWELFGEERTVMFTDLSGFSRRVAEFGIIHFLQVIHEQKRLLLPIVDQHDGLLLKLEADSMLVVFRRPKAALDCAIAMQHACRDANVGRAPEDQILLCVGLGHGRMLAVGDHEVWGAEVNAASKLGEDSAKSGEILATGGLRDAVKHVAGVTFTELELRVPGADRCYRAAYPA